MQSKFGFRLAIIETPPLLLPGMFQSVTPILSAKHFCQRSSLVIRRERAQAHTPRPTRPLRACSITRNPYGLTIQWTQTERRWCSS